MTGPSFTVHRLGPGDEETFRALNAVFREAFNEPDTYADQSVSENYLEGLLSREHIVPLVARSGDEVVGGLVAYELDKFEAARREIYIYDLAVREADRRKGVATALIHHLRSIAADREAWVIFVQADHGDDPAIALYTKLGTREDVLHFDIPVR
ncbi:AAC(3)-I family aminoglycoside N-acetyltransferase [Sphingomonas arenae]|uniref:AAC(3)-I family aminoglycoside N-acetyltransferase n=1 Tax=Sphingomonas arenae TaxID=2812555 RepID=UPI0019676E18|nr:AAC(3)-I family aminoglycoside N-acetyltransferase [Sphingomonas arenae]